MFLKHLIFFCFAASIHSAFAQCTSCGNGTIDSGETNLNCPQDVPHAATCNSPCAQPTSFESTAGLRISYDFIGTTTFSSAGLPAGWTFASGPSPTTSGTLAAAGTDTYGAKAGLVQPNCSGSCTATNGFCIGNLASSSTVFAGGTGGKLGANFDGRANVAQNLSYAVLRGQGNPTIVSPTYNFSAVEGFKIQFWLFPSESSCGQGNSWGSCVGNVAYLDFSTNGGTSWTQIMVMNLSSSNSDMCTNNTTNTMWLKESSWTRVCLTVFKSASSPGNFYSAASANTAPSGIMVNSTYFTSNFKFRIRYSQTASCTSGITTTNPGRYLAIDYPVVTSGNEMIPCGISFSNMCGYGADNNDDQVGGSGTTMTTVFGTTRRGINQAERGVEIFTSQNASYASQNLTGSNFTTNFDLCNAEGGDKQCIDWRTNNNFYNVVYECIADWEAVSGTGINLQYYKGTAPQSVGMTKVTTAGKTASIGWRYTATRFVSCGNTSDLNPGCNGYSFVTSSLPTQFTRGFYGLRINSVGQSWSYYGASSCGNYFNGPYLTPIATPDTLAGAGDYTVCVNGNLRFLATVDHCQTASGLSGNASLTITGPGGFNEVLVPGDTGLVNITTSGDYTITASAPSSPAQCIDCGRSICVTIPSTLIDDCMNVLPVELIHFAAVQEDRNVRLNWATFSEHNNVGFEIQRSADGKFFEKIGFVPGFGNTAEMINYSWLDVTPISGNAYYRLVQIDSDNSRNYSSAISLIWAFDTFSFSPNPASNKLELHLPEGGWVHFLDLLGNNVYEVQFINSGEFDMDITRFTSGQYLIQFTGDSGSQKVERLSIAK